jgi:hypothetical protein
LSGNAIYRATVPSNALLETSSTFKLEALKAMPFLLDPAFQALARPLAASPGPLLHQQRPHRAIGFEIDSRDDVVANSKNRLHEVAVDLIRSVFPPAKGIRLVGVTLSNFRSLEVSREEELPLAISPHQIAERSSAPT